MAALVTILTRTLGRPCLADAAASVAAQTYRPIEWLVVDAAGKGIEAPPAGDAEVRVVGSGAPMRRARAANAGIDHARGARLLLLDDDDLLLPDALARLSGALDAHPDARVAYGDAQVETAPGRIEFAYRFEWSELQLLRRNLFPVHSALFDTSLAREGGVRFDEALDWFEDWDFWLQASARAPFVHVRAFTALYRVHLSQSGAWGYDRPGGDPLVRRDARAVVTRHAARRQRLERELDARKRTARDLANRGDLAAAAQAWLGSHVLLPSDEEPVLGYAAIARRAGDLEAAAHTLRVALVNAPGSAALAGMLAAVMEEQGNAAGALAVVERAAAHRAASQASGAGREP